MQIELMKLQDLKPADYNPRVKLEPGMDEYKKLMKEFIQVRNKSCELYQRVTLYFNNENEHSKLIAPMRDFQVNLTRLIQREKEYESLNPSYISEYAFDTDNLQDIISEEIRKYLKAEWERVKKEIN